MYFAYVGMYQYKYDISLKSGGDLQNAEAMADRLTKLVYTASRIPVSPDRRETFQKISGSILI